ncbi:hypothetical protein [Flavobacterium sp. HJJ]|uniref:hypothetical protein n=1 Tax=Flavobacterium sp. HJJ TaxID=2783792 RepID=UPI00188DBB8C|nr:hypothetical protein [Flavobacterium sp. HJJ]MBF4472425.1 hypothetical protein [Flavobacterium sp. HJJ]
MFPESLSIRAENREYLTKKGNRIFELIPIFTGGDEHDNHKKTHQNADGLFLVAGSI